MERTLYHYYRSSASYRVRIGLNLKNLDYNAIHIHLLKDGGQQLAQEFKQINPQGLVPVYSENPNASEVFTQSLAILELLEECYPTPSILPKSPQERAKVRAFSQIIACDIHPLSNLKVLEYLKINFQMNDKNKIEWIHHWIQEGFSALEKQLTLQKHCHEFCFGNMPTLADICLIPQIYNAIRFQCPLNNYPTLLKIYKNCENLPAFEKALPIEP